LRPSSWHESCGRPEACAPRLGVRGLLHVDEDARQRTRLQERVFTQRLQRNEAVELVEHVFAAEEVLVAAAFEGEVDDFARPRIAPARHGTGPRMRGRRAPGQGLKAWGGKGWVRMAEPARPQGIVVRVRSHTESAFGLWHGAADEVHREAEAVILTLGCWPHEYTHHFLLWEKCGVLWAEPNAYE
jgi:hypothetical protein